MEANFIGEVADIYKCIVCHLVLKDPVLIIDCGHRLCKLCFDSMKKYASEHNNPLLCPHDRKEVDVEKVVDDRGVGRSVLDLQVYCDNQSECCIWTGELRQLEHHVDEQCRITKMQNFMERMEKRMDVRDTEVKALQERLSSKDEEMEKLKEDSNEQFSSMEKRLKDVESQLCEKDEEIALLRYELSCDRVGSLRHGGLELDKHVPSDDPKSKKRKVAAKMTLRGKENKVISDGADDEKSSIVHPGNDAIKDFKSVLLEISKLEKKLSLLELNNATLKSDFCRLKLLGLNGTDGDQGHGCSKDCFHCKQIRNLEERVMNVDSYIPDKRTVFIWKLDNFSYYEKRATQVDSPEFYSSPHGQCCNLRVQWKQNKQLAVFLNYRSGARKPNSPISMKFSISVIGSDGNVRGGSLRTIDFKENYIIKPGETQSLGKGFSLFQYPERNNFVMDDVLTITCELTDMS